MTTSPAAKSHGTLALQRLGSTAHRAAGCGRPGAREPLVSGAMPIAAMTTSQAISNSLPGMGSGRRRPDASGSPSAMRLQRRPLTRPSASPSDLDRRGLEAEPDALLLGVVGLDVVGRHLARGRAGRRP